MNNEPKLSIFTLRLRHERHVVHARQRARDISALLGFEHQEQIRLATAASEMARNAFRYASNGVVEFLVTQSDPQTFVISVSDSGPGIPDLGAILDGQYRSTTGMGMGILGTKRLMDSFEITSSPQGTHVRAGKALPAATPKMDSSRLRSISAELARSTAADPFDEIERQNQELLKTLAELRKQQDLLSELNRELEDTNRGVVALYAELDQHADDLRRVSDLKTSFLSNLSHEFRTPLNSITSLCRMLMNRSDGDLSAEQEKQIGFIQRSAAELTELVNELLDLAKVEAGKVDVKPRHFEIHDLFGAIRGMLKPLLSGNSLELTFDAAPGLPVLYTDEGKVSQILRNLVSNALKFTRRGYVRVTARAESEEWLLFTVEDTGIGVAPENHERIFEEFVQVENELQAQVKGTGLGLPLSKRLAVLLGGSISLESELGKGSIFTVRLPVCYGKPVRSQTVQPVNAGPTDKVVLFIEDNPETSFVHEASLRNSNYRGIFASNIPEARALLRASTPSAVVLDRFIDGQDSLFYIQELKTLGYTGPVIVISIVDDAKSALNAGADAFLAKPITTPAMTSTLGELIQGRNSRSVLLVDDDEVTRYVLGEALARLGYRVLEAHNGREAIRMAKANIPALMILDIVMPDLTGFEVLREIRGSPETKAISVLVHTSKEISTQESQYLMQMNAVFFPKQPIGDQVSSEQLREALASAGMEP